MKSEHQVATYLPDGSVRCTCGTRSQRFGTIGRAKGWIVGHRAEAKMHAAALAALRCDQCAGIGPVTTHPEHGQLCQTCGFRQALADDARDRFDHLTPGSLGFKSETE